MSPILAYLLFMVAGCCSGYLAGLFGIGGGVILVPILVFTFDQITPNPEATLHLAVGTSLAVVAVTNIFSARAQRAAGQVNEMTRAALLPGILIGVIVGAVIGAWLPRAGLIWVVVSFQITAAILFLLQPALRDQVEISSMPLKAKFLGASAGVISALVGIGGGTLLVPLMYFFGTPLRRAIGTSSALGVPIGALGATIAVISGLGTKVELPALAAGYVYLPAFFGCAAGAIFTAKHGVAHGGKIRIDRLRIAFAALLLVVTGRMALAAI